MAVMPITYGAVLATVCNRHLSASPEHGQFSRQIETIDITDGSVILKGK